jgi:ubiquinone/menaquinone biosynthesis C-methylase UbiE
MALVPNLWGLGTACVERGTMLPDYDHLFADQAEKYDRLVDAEDFQGNLLLTMRRFGHLNREQTVADLGTGTGRIAFLLAPTVRHVYGIEPVGGMLRVAESKKQRLGFKNVDFLPGEHADLPLPDHSIDLIVEGWAFLMAFNRAYPEWRSEFEAIVREMKRILRPSGAVILVETMGTLHMWEEVPVRTAVLYDYFEKELGLKKSTIRTDYRFSSTEEAVDLGTFFFGDEVGAEISQISEPVVLEATAVWHGKAISLPS